MNTLNSFFFFFHPLQAHLPFAVVGSVEEVKVGNKTVRARQYPWGVVEGKNPFTSKLIRACVWGEHLCFSSKHSNEYVKGVSGCLNPLDCHRMNCDDGCDCDSRQ